MSKREVSRPDLYADSTANQALARIEKQFRSGNEYPIYEKSRQTSLGRITPTSIESYRKKLDMKWQNREIGDMRHVRESIALFALEEGLKKS